MTYLLWLIPILAAIVLFALTKNTIAFKIGGAAFVAVLTYTLVHSAIMRSNLTSATEWWGNCVKSVHYYDDWDEEVSCRHPIYCTESYECGDSKHSRTCTREYVCGHEHLYDVDYHPEYWTLMWDDKSEKEITHQQYDRYSGSWGGKLYKIDLHRRYHSNDGNDMACDWDGRPETSETRVTEHRYENRVQASNSVFRADRVDSTDVSQYKLFEYPRDGRRIVMGAVIVDSATCKMLDYVNGYYGSRKQFKLFVCVFRGQPEVAAERQHSYWRNLNKNELLVCVGVDGANKVQWSRSFSWMDVPVLSVKVDRWFAEHKRLDLASFSRWLPAQVESDWSRKHFKDFNYIKIDITQSQYNTLAIVVVIMCLVQIAVTLYVIRDLDDARDRFR